MPLSPNLNEADALVALKQFDLDHIVLFDGIFCAGIESALKQLDGIKVHNAFCGAKQTPGLFQFKNHVENFKTMVPLENPLDHNSLLLRTSGTTSLPKVVPLRQMDLIRNACILAEGIGLTSQDVTYNVMPLDHIGGISASILSTLVVGASMTCDEQYTPQTMIEALTISQPQPTWYSAVPTIHNATLRHLAADPAKFLDENGRWMGHNLRMIRSGAASLKNKDRIRLENMFGCQVVSTYSMSEQMPISQPPIEKNGWDQKPDGVGVPVATSMAIVDSGTFKPLGYGEVGEICIRGASVFSGYIDNEKANLESRFLFKTEPDQHLDSWFKTGDLGEMAVDGTLFLHGRQKELIKRGGEQVSPFEVEERLQNNALVDTVVSFPVPSNVYGEEVACAIVLKEDAKSLSNSDTIKQLRRSLRDQKLAANKVPSVWCFVKKSEIPRTTTGKSMR